jgi:protein-disulfide isomerase
VTPDKLYAIHTELSRSTLSKDEMLDAVVKLSGLNKETIDNIAKSDKVSAQLENTYKLASEVGINGVPAFVVNGKYQPGYVSYEQLQALLKK